MINKDLAGALALAASAALAACSGSSGSSGSSDSAPYDNATTTTTSEATTSTAPPQMTLEEWTSSGNAATVQAWVASSWDTYTSIVDSLALGTNDGTAAAAAVAQEVLLESTDSQDAVAEALATAPAPLRTLLEQSQDDWKTGLEQLSSAVSLQDIVAANVTTGAAASAWTEADLLWDDLLPQGLIVGAPSD
jgi:hypothetical protein